MAKKQTRKSVSLEHQLHDLGLARAKSMDQNMTRYVSGLIRADLVAAGIAVPLPRHVEQREKQAPSEDPPMEKPRPPLSPAIALAAAKSPHADPKLVEALEFTRRKLEMEKSQPKPQHIESKIIKCWWCGDNFRTGEIINDHEGQTVHGKCKREINRLPGGVTPQ